MRFFYIFGLFLISSILSSQSLYYWQQKVSYDMDIYLDVNTNILSGNQRIVYYNNSPDSLNEIYFHLYWNAFKNNSYMHKKSISVNRGVGNMISKLSSSEEGDVKIKSIKINGKSLNWDEHDTILRLSLPQPLPPNGNVAIEVDFVSQVPLLTRRAGRDNSQGIRFSMAQWYPKIAEYDKDGWHHDEYAGREFYGVWGDFNVKITLDSRYIVASSGSIQNPEAVKCGYELGKVDTTIFEPASSSTVEKTKTWHFRAENVHDFAWAADDKFIHDITYWKDVTIHSLYIPSFRERWKNVKRYAEVMLDFYSETYGMYPYKTFTVVQAGDGGMEYPTIIFNAGYSPGLMAHEGGHQWFYGLLGNNESREAWLDEGIITYTTDKNTTERFNYPVKIEPESGLAGIFQLPYDQHNNYRSYWGISKLGIEEPSLTHSDFFKDDLAYSFGTYVKGSFIPPMLEYVVGDKVFAGFMKKYFQLWHFKHPQTSDFQRLAEKESGMELDWFFDEWLRTTKTCDYAVNSFNGKWIDINGIRKYRVSASLENRDDIIMPIDLQFNFLDGRTKKAIIPIDWNPKKEENAILLPRWKWIEKKYSFEYDFEEEVESIIIDPSFRLKDLNRLNNSSGFLPEFDINFIRPIQFAPPIDKYWITYRPEVWYSAPDGLRIGFSADGGYMGSPMIKPDYASRLNLKYLTKSKQIDYDFSFSFPMPALGNLTYLTASAKKMYGIKNFALIMDKIFAPWSPYNADIQSASVYYKFSQLVEDDFPFGNSLMDRGRINKIGISYNYQNDNGPMKFKLTGENSFNSAFNFSTLKLEYLQKLPFVPVNMRVYTGLSSDLPPRQEMFYLSSANPAEGSDDPIFESLLFLNRNFSNDTRFHLSGGGNITSKTKSNLFARNIISLNLEGELISLEDIGVDYSMLKPLSLNAFSNMANIWNSGYKKIEDFFNKWYIEAGISIAWSPFENSRMLTGIIKELEGFNIKFNMPLILNRVPADKEYFDWRWNISIGKLINL